MVVRQLFVSVSSGALFRPCEACCQQGLLIIARIYYCSLFLVLTALFDAFRLDLLQMLICIS